MKPEPPECMMPHIPEGSGAPVLSVQPWCHEARSARMYGASYPRRERSTRSVCAAQVP